VVPNPLQQVVPPIIKGIGAAVGGLKGGLAAAADQLTSGPATQSAIAYFADKVRCMQQQQQQQQQQCLGVPLAVLVGCSGHRSIGGGSQQQVVSSCKGATRLLLTAEGG
jgi:hypothetical protein